MGNDVSVSAGNGQTFTLHYDSAANAKLAAALAANISAGVADLSIIAGIDTTPGLFNAQYMTRMARIALMPPKAMRCRPSETL